MIVDKNTQKIICTNYCNGKKHDFRLFKESNLKLSSDTKLIIDTRYPGIKKIHDNAKIPHKKTKKNPLTKKQKKENRDIASKRVLNENVIGKVKRFKVVAERYRNRRKRFALRFNIIAGIYNFELVSG